MISRLLHKQRFRGFIGSLIGLLVVGYLGYHAVQGERGVLSLAHLTNEIEEARALLAMRQAEEAVLRAKVERLSPDALDRDLLDERARGMLNRVRPDEYVIPLDPSRVD